MPVVYTAPIVTSQSVNASKAKGFCVNLQDGIIDIMYEDGTRDPITLIFTPIGDVKNMHLDKATYSAIVAANPTLYANLKALINSQILVAKNQPGSIV